MLALALVAVSLGLSNFAGAIGIGMSGVDAGLRVRLAVVFAVFEGGMPAAGLLIGHHVAGTLGASAKPVGGALLGATGALVIISGLRRSGSGSGDAAETSRTLWRLIVVGAVLSVDNLAVGFALGAYHVNLVAGIAVIASVSVVLSLVGLELGSRIGRRLDRWGDVAGGAALVAVGVAIGTGVL